MSKLLKLYRNAHKPTPSNENITVSQEASASTGLLCFLLGVFFIPVTGGGLAALALYLLGSFILDRTAIAKNATSGEISNKEVLSFYSEKGKPVDNPQAALQKTAGQLNSFIAEFNVALDTFIKHRESAYKTLTASLKKNDRKATGVLVNKCALEASKLLPGEVMSKWNRVEFLGRHTLVSEDEETGDYFFECSQERNIVTGVLKHFTGSEIVTVSKIQSQMARDVELAVKTTQPALENFNKISQPSATLRDMGIEEGGDQERLNALFGDSHTLRHQLNAFHAVGDYVVELNHATDMYVKLSVK